jgi:hypothetical protein
MSDIIDHDMPPVELRREWAKRGAAALARYAGISCITRDGSVRWLGRDGRRVIAWRKRGRLYVETGEGTATALTSRPGVHLLTWGQLELLVAGLVPRASEFGQVAS